MAAEYASVAKLGCPDCGSVGVRLSFDHCVPVSRGGSTTRWNVRVVCLLCNRAKGALTAREWTELRNLCVGLGVFKMVRARLAIGWRVGWRRE